MPEEKCSITNIRVCLQNLRDWAVGSLKQARSNRNNCSRYKYDRVRYSVVPTSGLVVDPLRDFVGISTGGVNTAIAIPKLRLMLDAGPAIADLDPTDRVFVSHTDGDHFDGLRAVICESTRRAFPINVFISKEAKPVVEKIRRAMQGNTEIKVNFHYVNPGEVWEIDDRTRYEFFPVIHTPTSVGLAVHRKDDEGWRRILTYTGDISVKEMFAQGLVPEIPALWQTDVLVTEASMPSSMTAIIPFMELARVRHSSISDVDDLVKYATEHGDIKSVVMTHVLGLPPFISSCNMLVSDIKDHFTGKGVDVSFLSTCSEWLHTTTHPKKPRSVLAEKS